MNIKRIEWEDNFNTHQISWKSFHQKTKILEDWISNAQLIVNEKNEDYDFLINKHKVKTNINFFYF